MSKPNKTEQGYKNHPYWKYERHAESFKIDEARGLRGVRTRAALYYAEDATHTCSSENDWDTKHCAACIMFRSLREIHYNLTMM